MRCTRAVLAAAVLRPHHRRPQAVGMPPKKVKGAKAKKQQGGKAKSRGAGNRRNNPKAFGAASGTKAQARNAYRTLEKQERKYHISLTDRSVEVEVRSPPRCPAPPPSPLHARPPCLAQVAPPFVVAVVGPPGVGKSTLIRSLVKHWTKQNLNEPVGPVTIITGKKRRITVVECPNDLNAMCDIAKVHPHPNSKPNSKPNPKPTKPKPKSTTKPKPKPNPDPSAASRGQSPTPWPWP